MTGEPLDAPTGAPFDLHADAVLPEWVDYNGHMNLAYYVVIFDRATDALFDAVGLDLAYRETTGHGTFAAETHTLYERELRAGERVRVATWVLGADEKRLHLAHEMLRTGTGERASAQELLYLSVDLAARRAAPWRAGVAERLAETAAAHARLPRPAWIGRRVALRQARPG